MNYNYIEKGKGDAVIMLHGMFGQPSNWIKIIDALAGKRRILALELPYLALSKEKCDILYLADYVLKFADSLGIDRSTYIGNSLGGHIALDIAIKNQRRVKSLILTGSSGLYERGYEEDLQIHPTREYMKKKIEEIFYDKSFVTDKIVDLAYDTLLNRRYKLNIVRLSKSAKGYNVKELLHNIKCPTLLIWGKEDTITPPSVAVEFNKNIKNSRLEFIDRCCHAPMMEYPDKFGALVLDFLTANR